MNKYFAPAAAFGLIASVGVGVAAYKHNQTVVAANQETFADDIQTEAAAVALETMEASKRSPETLASPIIGAYYAEKTLTTQSGQVTARIVYDYDKIPNIMTLDTGELIMTVCDSVKIELADAATPTVNGYFKQAAYEGQPLHSIQLVGNCRIPGTDEYMPFTPVLNVIQPGNKGPVV